MLLKSSVNIECNSYVVSIAVSSGLLVLSSSTLHSINLACYMIVTHLVRVAVVHVWNVLTNETVSSLNQAAQHH